MKQKLELSIAMLELADNKISKTRTHDHDIANRMIDSFRTGLRNVAFQNIARNEMAIVLQAFKLSRDNGEILDLELLLSEIVGVFGRGEEEPEPTLQAAMLVTTNRVEYQDQRGTPGAGGASRLAQPYKRDLMMTSPRRHKTPASSIRFSNRSMISNQK